MVMGLTAQISYSINKEPRRIRLSTWISRRYLRTTGITLIRLPSITDSARSNCTYFSTTTPQTAVAWNPVPNPPRGLRYHLATPWHHQLQHMAWTAVTGYRNMA